MSECSKGKSSCCEEASVKSLNEVQQKAFWGWWNKETTFTKADVDELLDRVKVFNAGAIDDYLTTHVDKVYVEWLEEKRE